MDHKILNSIIESLHGEATANKVCCFERAHLQVSRLKLDLAFLKRCRDSSIIPFFARIKHRLHTPRNHQVFLKASLALIRAEISRVRNSLSQLSRVLLDLNLDLGNLFSASLWVRIDAYSTLKSLRLEEIRKQKQASKFLRLAGDSEFLNRAVGAASHSRISCGQISALNDWLSGRSGGSLLSLLSTPQCALMKPIHSLRACIQLQWVQLYQMDASMVISAQRRNWGVVLSGTLVLIPVLWENAPILVPEILNAFLWTAAVVLFLIFASQIQLWY